MANRVALAEALLRRRELQEKVEQLRKLKVSDVFDDKVERIKVSDGIDELRARFSKLDAGQVTAEFDYYAAALRRVDAVIQRTNWETEITLADSDMLNWNDRLNQ